MKSFIIQNLIISSFQIKVKKQNTNTHTDKVLQNCKNTKPGGDTLAPHQPPITKKKNKIRK